MTQQREKILEVFFGLIAEKGYDKSSINQIAEVIGVKKPSIYYYFKTKEVIFITLFEVLSDEMLECFFSDDLEIDKANYFEVFDQSGHMFIDYLSENKDFCKVNLEFLVQSNRIEGLSIRMADYQMKMKQYHREAFEYGISIGALCETFDIEMGVDALGVTLIGIENSIAYDFDCDIKRYWSNFVKCLLKSS